MRKLRLQKESWPLASRFAISRGSRTTSEVVLVEIGQEQRMSFSLWALPLSSANGTLDALVKQSPPSHWP